MIDRLTEGSVILVGSGMGAWISLVAAQFIAYREEVAEELAAKVGEAKPAPQIFFPSDSKLHSLGMHEMYDLVLNVECLINLVSFYYYSALVSISESHASVCLLR